MAKVFQAECRYCRVIVSPSISCEHLEVNDQGQAYELQSGHPPMLDQNAEVILAELPGAAPELDSLSGGRPPLAE